MSEQLVREREFVEGIEQPSNNQSTVSPSETKRLLQRLRERDKPLLASGEPAHGPG
jgi:hypothetical protein